MWSGYNGKWVRVKMCAQFDGFFHSMEVSLPNTSSSHFIGSMDRVCHRMAIDAFCGVFIVFLGCYVCNKKMAEEEAISLFTSNIYLSNTHPLLI